jgi:iron complex outermembrane receptor protein
MRSIPFLLLAGPLVVQSDAGAQSPVAATATTATTYEAAESDHVDEILVQGFLGKDSGSAMKVDVPVRDTPFFVSNYSEELIKSLDSLSVSDMYQYMTGVSRGGQSAYDLSLRGFKTTSNDRNAIMADGLPGQSARFGSPLTINIDHIEVVKGPASVLYGKAQPGGFVNVVSKRPLETAQQVYSVRGTTYEGDGASFGDQSGYAVNADFTGPIADGKFLYRVVGEYNDRDSFRDFAFEKNKFIAPSFTWNIGDSTKATVHGEYRWRDASQDFYVPAPNRDVSLIPDRNIRLQEPDDHLIEIGYVAGFSFEHRFANDSVFKFATRSVRNEDDTTFYDPVAVLADGETLQRRARVQFNQRKSDYADLSFSIPFETGFLGHRLLMGATVGRDNLDANRRQFVNGATTGPLAQPGPGSLNINIYNPVYGQSPRHEDLPLGQFQKRLTGSETHGFYVTDFLTFSEHWKATIGVRSDYEDQFFRESLPTQLPERTRAASDVYPMAGLLFQPNKFWSLYASYSTSFVPQAPNFQDATGNNPFEPETGTQYEAGVKAELMDGRFTMTLAAFDIEKKNTLALVTCNPGVAGTCMQTVGQETSDGVEMELSFRPVPNWQTLIGYAKTDAKVARATTGAAAPLVGSRLTNAPEVNAHLWTRYEIESGPLTGFSVGFGVVHVSEQAGNLVSLSNTRLLTLPSYTTADLSIYYRLQERYDLALKFGNITDELYYDSVGSTLAEQSVVPGAPRSVSLSVTFSP